MAKPSAPKGAALIARKAADVTRAQAKLAAARLALARATRPSHPHAVVSPSARWSRVVLESHADWLRERPTVLGYGLSHRDGKACVVVYVTEASDAKLPAYLKAKDGRRLPVFAVELRDFEHCAAAGSSIGPTNPSVKGTIGAFASDASGNVFALTAMHVSSTLELSESDPPLPAFAPSRQDDPQASRLGAFVHGTSTDVDVGKILVADPSQISNQVPGVGTIRGWRPVVDPADRGIPVRMCGAMSGLQFGRIETPNADFPNLNLRSAIVAHISSQRGDSGAPLLDSQNLVLGFLKGRVPSNPLAIFSSVGIALSRLDCDIPTI